MIIRKARRADWPAIIDIYNEAVDDGGCTADTEHVTVAEREDWFLLHDPANYPIFVAAEDTVAGWCSLSPWRSGRAALKSCAEISYYIARAQRGRGIGSKLVEHALATAPELGLRSLLAILLDVNQASVRLLEKYHFRKWGHLPDVAVFADGTCGQLIFGRESTPGHSGMNNRT